MGFFYRSFQQTLMKKTYILQNIMQATFKLKIAENHMADNLFVSNYRIHSLLKTGFSNPHLRSPVNSFFNSWNAIQERMVDSLLVSR